MSYAIEDPVDYT